MKKLFQIFTVFVIIIFLIFIIGPRPQYPRLSPKMPEAPLDLKILEDSIHSSEAALPVKDNNQAHIVWFNDSIHKKTSYSLVYLHGFSASWEEGNPLCLEFAKRYGCNLYLSRLAFHGLKDSDAFKDLTADSLYNSAKMALRIGTRIGDSVILMSTSAGGALALTLAALEKGFPIKALILYSPCVKIFDPKSAILDQPWGLSLARFISKGNYLRGKDDKAAQLYWYPKYRLEGLVALQTFLDKSMQEKNFRNIHIPVLCLAYYKNEKTQDSTVSVSAMRAMFSELGTPQNNKEYLELPNVGDHVMASSLRSKDLNSVRKASFSFAENHLFLKPIR